MNPTKPTNPTNPMHPMICRFYGRYVMVERGGADGAKKTLTFLMPDMTFGGSDFKEHRALMTIARHFVDHRQTTLTPTFRSMTDGHAKEAEDFIWDLAGWELNVGATGGVTIEVEKHKEIVDLAELEKIQGREAELKASLEPGKGSIVSAAVIVGGGRAYASTAFHTPPCSFIALSDANTQEPTRLRDAKAQIDIIDITLPPAHVHLLTLKNKRETHHITLNAGMAPTIGLSNLCNELPHTIDVDREFAQYYHVLQTVADDRLVPKVVAFGGDEDCNRPTRICV